MSRTLSNAFKAAAFAQETGEVVTALLTITHPDTSEIFRISSDPTTRIEGGPNFISQPTDFISGWTVTNLPIDPDVEPGPIKQGGFADAAVPDMVDGVHDLVRTFPGVSGEQPLRFDLICKLKAGNSRVMLLLGTGANGVVARFDLADLSTFGVLDIGAGTGVFAEITDLGGGWRHCRLEGTPNNGTTARAVIRVLDGGASSYPGNGVDGVYLYSALLQVPGAPSAEIQYGTYSRGQTFLFIPFRLKLPAEQDNAPPAAQVVLDNVGRDLIALLRSTVTPAQVLIEVVLPSAPDTVEISFPLLDLADTSYDAGEVTLDLVIDYLINEPFPAESFDPSGFPALFG